MYIFATYISYFYFTVVTAIFAVIVAGLTALPGLMSGAAFGGVQFPVGAPAVGRRFGVRALGHVARAGGPRRRPAAFVVVIAADVAAAAGWSRSRATCAGCPGAPLGVCFILDLHRFAQHFVGFLGRHFSGNRGAHSRRHRFLAELLFEMLIPHTPNVRPVYVICQFRCMRELTL